MTERIIFITESETFPDTVLLYVHLLSTREFITIFKLNYFIDGIFFDFTYF